MIKTPKILIKSQHDRSVPISIKLEHDCHSEYIYAEVYDKYGGFVGNVNAILPTLDNIFPENVAIGNAKGTELNVYCDFRLIDPGEGYGLVFKANGVGVVASYVLAIYRKNNYNLPGKCDGDEKVVYRTRTVSSYSDKSIFQITYVWSTGDPYMFVLPDETGQMHQMKIGGLDYNNTFYQYTPGDLTLTIDPLKIVLQNGDRITLYYYKGEVEEDVITEGVFDETFDETFN
jgi:hypothetical protein